MDISNITPFQWGIVASGAIVIALIVWQTCIYSKRRLRRAELRHLIDLIDDPHGNDDAIALQERCLHISAHYHIPLAQVGIQGGKQELMDKVFRSNNRTLVRREKANRILAQMGQSKSPNTRN